MTERPVRFGLVGCGRIGSSADERVRHWPMAHLWLPYAHATAIKATSGAELVAVCDVEKAAARAAAEQHGVAASYTDCGTMLSREKLDALAIATRTRERAAVIRAALSAGVRALYCEKPLSNTLEEADELTAALERAKVAFVYGTKRRYMPVFDAVRDRVRAGEIGQPVTIIVRFGRGPLLWSHPHSVDIASFLASDPDVDCVEADLDLDAGTVSGVVVDGDPVIRVAHIRYKSGANTIIIGSASNDVEVCGPGGTICVRGDGHAVHDRMLRDATDLGWLLAEKTDVQEIPSSGTQRSIAALVAAVRHGVDPGYRPSQAARNQEVLFAMVESHLANGARVSLPLRRRGLTITGRTGDLLA